MPPPSTVVCEICGGKYSKHSLVIHQKQCMVKRELSTAFCPCCDQIVSNDEYSSHVTKCRTINERALREKKLAAEKAAKAGSVAPGGGGGGGGKAGGVPLPGGRKEKPVAPEPIPPPKAVPPRSKIPESVLRRLEAAAKGVVELTPEQKLTKRIGSPCDACGTTAADTLCLGCHAVYCAPCSGMLHEANKQLTVENGHSPVFKEVVEEKEGLEAVGVDNRIPCATCTRKFDPMRIAKHQLVCATQDRKVIKVKHATDLRVKGTEFETFLKKKGVLKGGVLVEKEPPPKAPSKWRKEHEQILSVAGAAETSTPAPPAASATATAAAASITAPAAAPAAPSTGAASDTAAATAVVDPASAAPPAKPAAPPKPKLRVGDKVTVEREKGPVVGTLQFKGPVWGMAKGTWYGIELDTPSGDNDGAYNSVHYFYCPQGNGLFVKPESVKKVEDPAAPTPPTPAPAAPAAPPKPLQPTATPSLPPKQGAGSAAPQASTSAPAAPAIVITPSVQSKPLPSTASTPTSATRSVTPTAKGGSSVSTSAAPIAPALAAAAASNPWLKKLAPAATTNAAAAAVTIPPPSSAPPATPPRAQQQSSPTPTAQPSPRPMGGSIPSASTSPVLAPTTTITAPAPGSATTRVASTAAAPPPAPLIASSSAGGSPGETAPPPALAPKSAAPPLSLGAFSGALASKLRTKVAAERGVTLPGPSSSSSTTSSSIKPPAQASSTSRRLVDQVKSKQAAGGGAPPPLFAPTPSVKALSGTGGGSGSLAADLEAKRLEDIARSVDYLKVLAGEKSKLSADPRKELGHTPFGGVGNKVGGGGGGGSSGPSTDLYKNTAGPRRVVGADGKLGLARGATDAAAERERRLAAIEARMANAKVTSE